MAIAGKVRERMRKFFNPESIDSNKCREVLMMALIGLVLIELMVWVLVKHSADLGELPHYTQDAVVIGISLLEVLLAPLLCWLGMQRRRSVMVGWILLCLVTTITLFALPDPEITKDAGLCSAAVPPSFPSEISTNAAIRLSLLVISGVACALGRVVITGHGLAYINEHTPSVNLHMHVGILVLCRVLAYLVGISIKTGYIETPVILLAVVVFQFSVVSLRLFSYPDVAPRVQKLHLSDRGLFRSMCRVFSNGVAVLLILAAALLTSGWWGFRMHEGYFIQVKYNFLPEIDPAAGFATVNLRFMPVLLGVILAGYLYTVPLMPKYDRKAAVSRAASSCFGTAVVFILLTAALSCEHPGFAGAGDTYNQPACGQSCGCDRPWMEYTPVCASEQMTTYFSPCHAGCSDTGIVNSYNVYSNCSCALGGSVTVGPCTDGSCDGAYAFHQILVVLQSLFSTLALVWLITAALETVDKRDVGVAVGIMMSFISLFTFVGTHVFYMWIRSSTCALTDGYKCLLQNDLFVPWVGYSSVFLIGLAFILSVISSIIIGRQKEPTEDGTFVEPL